MNERSSPLGRILGYIGLGLIGTVKALIVIPWLLRYLGHEGYGLYVVAMTTLGYVAIAAQFGQENALYRFLPARIDKPEGRLLFNSTVQFASLWLGLGVIGAGAFAVVGPLDGRTSALLVLGAVALAGMTLFSLAISHDRCRQNIERYMALNILHQIGEIVVIVASAWYWQTVVGIMAALAVFQCLAAATVLVPRLARIGVTRGSTAAMKRSLHFGAHNVLIQLLNSSIYAIDKYIMGLAAGLAALSYYGPAFALASVFMRFSAVAMLAMPTQLSAALESGDRDAELAGLRYGLKFYGALSIPAMVGLALIGKDILRMITSQALADRGYPVCMLLSAAVLLLGYGRLLTQVLVVHLQMRRVNLLLASDVAAFAVLSAGAIRWGADPAIALGVSYLLVFLVSGAVLLLWAKRLLPGAYGMTDQIRMLVASLAMIPPLPFLDLQRAHEVFGYIVVAIVLYAGGLLATRTFGLEEVPRALRWRRA